MLFFAPTILANQFTPKAVANLTAWYDPSDLTTLFQDTAGTTPVTVDGDPVARVNDKSGNGYNLLQSNASKRPLYKTSGGLKWLLFDGVDDILSAAYTIAQPWVRVSAIRTPSPVSGGSQALGGVAINTGVLFFAGTTSIDIYSGGIVGSVPIVAGTDYCATERHNGASSRIATNNNGYQSGNAGATLPGGISVGGSQAAGSGFSAIRFYGGAVYAADVADADISQLRTLVGSKAGLTL